MQQLQTVRSDSSDPKLQFKEVTGFRTQVVTHLFPVKKGGCSLHQNKPSLAPGSGSDPSSCSPSSALALSHSPARQGVEQDKAVFHFGGKDVGRIRNISTSHHYFYLRIRLTLQIEP